MQISIISLQKLYINDEMTLSFNCCVYPIYNTKNGLYYIFIQHLIKVKPFPFNNQSFN